MQVNELLLTNRKARPGTKITPKGVVIHWTANEGEGADTDNNRDYFNRPTTVASAHYIVDCKQIVRCLPENEMGYHVGAKTYKPDALKRLSSYPNNCTIGIEMCVNADGDFKAMYRRTVELTADILCRYGWGADKLWRHHDITGKDCPAFFVDDNKAKQYMGMSATAAWQKFKSDVQEVLRPKPAPTPDYADVPIIYNHKPLTTRAWLDKEEGRVMLPIRKTMREMGKESLVGWCADTNKVLLCGKVMDDTEVINGEGYVWAREVAEALGMTVQWDGTKKTLHLSDRA